MSRQKLGDSAMKIPLLYRGIARLKPSGSIQFLKEAPTERGELDIHFFI